MGMKTLVDFPCSNSVLQTNNKIVFNADFSQLNFFADSLFLLHVLLSFFYAAIVTLNLLLSL